VLAAAGVASRRDAEQWIQAGRVAVNGSVVSELGTRVDPDADEITVDGRRIETRVEKLYLLLNKPKGVVSTREDPHALRNVIDLVRSGLEARMGRGHPAIEGLHPVGRLDADTEGLLLLTNDGDFTFALTHPRHQVPKTYLAVVRGKPSREALERLRGGIVIEGRATSPAEARLVDFDAPRSLARVEVVLREGRKRQVREMLKAVGHHVQALTRTQIGHLGIGGLKPGQWRALAPGEVRHLLEAAHAEGGEAQPKTAPAGRSPSQGNDRQGSEKNRKPVPPRPGGRR